MVNVLHFALSSQERERNKTLVFYNFILRQKIPKREERNKDLEMSESDISLSDMTLVVIEPHQNKHSETHKPLKLKVGHNEQ